jgi:uncharacterized membrane protein
MGVSARKFFSAEEKNEIKEAIKEAEKNTSGEIRVHIENKCKGEVLDRAAFLFKQLGMEKTKLRNGVLFYLALKNRQFAILGDQGINAVVPEDFWNEIAQMMTEKFKEGKFKEGLVQGILRAGKQLKGHFPHQKDDINELSDEISFGE